MPKDEPPMDDLHELANSPVAIPARDTGDDWSDEPLDKDPGPLPGLLPPPSAVTAWSDVEESASDEPLTPVDAPVPMRGPFGQSEKRRNHRLLPG